MKKFIAGSISLGILAVLGWLFGGWGDHLGLARAAAQPWPTPDPANMILPADPQPYANFGAAMAASGDWLAVGAPGADLEGARNAGAVYLFQKQGKAWVQTARLTPDPPQEEGRFGSALAMDGEILAAGAPNEYNAGAGNASGAVYLFNRQRQDWALVERLTVEGGRPFDLFGSSLALQEHDLAAAGRGFDGPAGQRDSGAVFLFRRERGGWRMQTRLSGEAAFDHFGHALAFAGEQLLVSSPDAAASQVAGAGQISIFQRTPEGWSGPTLLTARSPRYRSHFGFDLDVQEDRLVVVASQEYQKSGDPPPNALAYESAFGVAHIFERKGDLWEWQARLIPQPADEQHTIRMLQAVFLPGHKPGRVITGGYGPSVLFPFELSEGGWQALPALDLPVFVLNEGLSLVQTGDQVFSGSRFYEIPQPDGSLRSAGAVWIFQP